MGLFNRLFKPKETARQTPEVIATLTLANETYEVVALYFDIAQDVYSKSRPDGNVYGGRIRCTIDGDLSERMIAWGVYNYKREDGEIRFYPGAGRQTQGSDLTIRFENANCLSLHRRVRVGETRLTELTIAPHRVKIAGDEFENQWKEDKIYG